MARIVKLLWSGVAFALSNAMAAAPATLESQVVEIRQVGQTWVADASVEAVRQATLSVQVSGRILEVKAETGQSVKAGQVLMRVDAREATAGVAAAEARLMQAQAQNTRLQSLLERKFVSKAAVDQSDADLNSARADMAAARAGMSHGVLTAPMDGVVGQRLAEVGDLATPGKPLLTVFDPARMRLVASVPQAYLAALDKGGQDSVRARVELPEQQRWLEAVRVEILPLVDPQTRNATLRVYLPEYLRDIAPGMFARVHLPTGVAQKLYVPKVAVLRRSEATLVYVIDARGAAHLRQVRLGAADAAGFEVLAGLSAGERVSLQPLQAAMTSQR